MGGDIKQETVKQELYRLSKGGIIVNMRGKFSYHETIPRVSPLSPFPVNAHVSTGEEGYTSSNPSVTLLPLVDPLPWGDTGYTSNHSNPGYTSYTHRTLPVTPTPTNIPTYTEEELQGVLV